jgi:hypothetical protein
MAMHRIQLISEVPANLPTSQLENVRYAALELCTAIMEYVALAIKLLKKPFIGAWPLEASTNHSERHVKRCPRQSVIRQCHS